MSDHEPDDRPPVPPTPWQPPADSGPAGSQPPASAPPEPGPPPLPGPPARSDADEPPSPGWWKASDGNWYPPHQHPRYQQQPQEPLVPPPPGQPAGYQSYGDQYGGQVYGGYQTYGGPPPSNGLATASLVLGIISILMFWSFGFGVLLGILAIIFGVMGNNKAKELPGEPLAGRAKAGLITGIIGTIGGVIFFVFIFAAVGEAIDDIEAETRDGFCNPDNFFDPDC